MVCALTESKLKSRNHDNMYQIPGYNMVRIDRPESKKRKEGGGMVLYVNEIYDFQIYELELTKPDITEYAVLKIIRASQKPILVAVVYLPPDISSEKESLEFLESLFFLLRSEKFEFIITGDFNIDLTKTTESKRLISISKEFNTYQTIKTPTRIASKFINNEYRTTKILIDHMYVSNLKKFHKSGTLWFSSSDQ